MANLSKTIFGIELKIRPKFLSSIFPKNLSLPKIRYNTVRSKILILNFAIILISTIIFSANSYREQKKALIKGIDNSLRIAAFSFTSIVPKGFHDDVFLNPKKAKERYQRYVKYLTNYVNKAKLTYLYSYVKIGDKFCIATTSASPKEIRTNTIPRFLTPYKEPPSCMIVAWNTNTIQYGNYRDEWGEFRSIFVPMEDSKGTRYIVGADFSLSLIHKKLRKSLITNVGIGFLLFLTIWIISHLLFKRLLQPISNLTLATNSLTSHNFTLGKREKEELSKIGTSYHDEIGQLARSFLEMNQKLGEYMINLQEVTKEKERVANELKIAKSIQMSFLPKKTDFPQKTEEFEIYTFLEEAREVGGDFYDIHLVDEKNLFLAIGDVSDKGVPAALFMAATLSIYRGILQHEKDPSRILELLNKELRYINQNRMFVTMFCGAFDTDSGKLHYASAGHNPPIVVPEEKEPFYLPVEKQLPLGIFDGVKYEVRKRDFCPGDTLFLYTDGVTEARNRKREFFTEKRLVKEIQKFSKRSPKEMIEGIYGRIMKFYNGAPLSDDITMVALKIFWKKSGTS